MVKMALIVLGLILLEATYLLFSRLC